MSTPDNNLIFMVLQFLNEGKYEETAQRLERESGVYFNLNYFENEVKRGNWDEVERYLLGFTKVDSNRYSVKMFFEIRKIKYLEAIERHDFTKAVDILKKDLLVFKAYDEELFKDMTQLLALENIREHEHLSNYGDTESARASLSDSLSTLLVKNPLLKDKLQFPSLGRSRLHTLINHRLSGQESHLFHPRSNYSIQTGGLSLPSAHQNDNTKNLENVLPIMSVIADDKSMAWRAPEIGAPAGCQSLQLPDQLSSNKISGLIYTNSGTSIFAISSNATHLLWKWPQNDSNLDGKVTASIAVQLCQPKRGNLMIDDRNPEFVPSFALSNNDCYVISSSGGKISLSNMNNFARMKTFMDAPPAATSLMFYPEDNNIIVIGMEDSSIKIYDFGEDKVVKNLEGHNSRRITGLAFSQLLNVLVSSDEHSKLCVWKWNTWERLKKTFLQFPAGRRTVLDTRVQFHQDQIHFLVLHQSLLAMYETTRLERVNQWAPGTSSAPITDATLSCDSQLVFVSFMDASVCVFCAANLQLQCRINPYAYLPASPAYMSWTSEATYIKVPQIRFAAKLHLCQGAPLMVNAQPGISSKVYPLVIAAHPSVANQFALGLTNGCVHVIEPLESIGRWGVTGM